MIAASGLVLRTLSLTVPATLASWLAMMVVHESGHVVAAWLSGGKIEKLVLHPLEFSRTDLSVNPHPLFVAFAGAVWGSVAPVLIWRISRALGARTERLFRFFAGFCLVANGAYLATALIAPVGDAADILRHGAPTWAVALPGMAFFATGLAFWNGLSSAFVADSGDRRLLITTWSGLAGIVAAMLVWSAR